MGDHSNYQSPFVERYASSEMLQLFSPQHKFSIWRRLWVALARAERDLGIPITLEQISAMEANVAAIDFDAAAHYEGRCEHDVMAHILAFGEQCPEAKGIIHLGATSCYVTDNGDLIQMRDGMKLLIAKIKVAITELADFAKKNSTLACLGYTHLQAAQLTTIGKRSCLWLQDLLFDYDELNHRINHLRFLGVKGATGTQASFLALFDGEIAKVRALEEKVAALMGFERIFPIAGQTYTRKQDLQILQLIASLAASAHKFATDIRLLAHLKEVEEPFSALQVGSSAMPYKRNPILSERICALARFAISLSDNGAYTAATQWLERSLDDSANRRLSIAEAFLSADAILELLIKVAKGLIVHPKMIEKHIDEELPFLAIENFLMASVKKGGDRQVLHEKLRCHCQEATVRIKEEGLENDLLERIAADPAFETTVKKLQALLKIEDFIGCAPDQVDVFLATEVYPRLQEF